jgi:transposase
VLPAVDLYRLAQAIAPPAWWRASSAMGVRHRTRVFSELQSHYVFADRFGRPGKGNDKGKVEGLIGWIRRNLLVPVPRAVTLTALNEQLL